jgi:hypothetical protein
MGLEYVAAFLSYTVIRPGTLGGMMDSGWLYFLILVYLPCLWMVMKGPGSPLLPGRADGSVSPTFRLDLGS